MKKDKNVCIRIDRDEIQINRCKSKVEQLEAAFLDYSNMLRLIGNEVRMKLLFLLQEEERLCVCDLSEILEMKVPAVSQHLRKLKDGKLVFTQREGVTIYYKVTPDINQKLNTIFSALPKATFV